MLSSYSKPDIYLTNYSKSIFFGPNWLLDKAGLVQFNWIENGKKMVKNHFKMQGNICPMKKLLGASNARGQTTKKPRVSIYTI